MLKTVGKVTDQAGLFYRSEHTSHCRECETVRTRLFRLFNPLHVAGIHVWMVMSCCVALTPQGCGLRRFVRDARFAGTRGVIPRCRGGRHGGFCTRARGSSSSLSCYRESAMSHGSTPLRVQAASVLFCLQQMSSARFGTALPRHRPVPTRSSRMLGFGWQRAGTVKGAAC